MNYLLLLSIDRPACSREGYIYRLPPLARQSGQFLYRGLEDIRALCPDSWRVVSLLAASQGERGNREATATRLPITTMTAHLLWEQARHKGKDVAYLPVLSREEDNGALCNFLGDRPGRPSTAFRTYLKKDD